MPVETRLNINKSFNSKKIIEKNENTTAIPSIKVLLLYYSHLVVQTELEKPTDNNIKGDYIVDIGFIANFTVYNKAFSL